MSATRVGIVNVTGYAGAETARILANHPHVEVTCVTGRSAAGQSLQSVFPHLAPVDQKILPEVDEVDFVIAALPHHATAEIMPALLERVPKVVDISADFRLQDVPLYEQWYGDHPAPQLIPEAVFGIPELHTERIRKARLVANPGCFSTAAILGLAPIAHLIEPGVIIDGKTGISGAGRSSKVEYNFNEINENCSAYGLKGHRHLPEMEQELGTLRSSGNMDLEPLDITFVPHLVPMTRGILDTCYARLRDGMSQEDLTRLYESFYAETPFTRVVHSSPQTKQTLGSNHCIIHPRVDEKTGRVLVLSCLDNLVKGAAGQAVQNMNLMLGLPEDAGLGSLAVYP
ncbi:MAG TPA: N-acetyl-gamma-glutamyl-phosphate reductase [Chloroflexota bacterium]|jgi:N-acetyl-gamma-glutamyl-phosphate reductase|nr:N-acetyl-gamma-glutamyl-phosphate reductase [Chloroflexota bacterium]